MSALWLLALPIASYLFYLHVADAVHAIPDSNDDFHL